MGRAPIEIGLPLPHLWLAELAPLTPFLKEPGPLLDEAENRRADRFRNPEDAARYRIVHVLLRLLASAYLDRSPASIPCDHDSRGAPQPFQRPGAPPLSYSLSYRAGIALFGFCAGSRIGVDIERVRSEMVDDLVSAAASPEERGELEALSARERETAAFRMWTMKEAALKLLGRGLSVPPDQVIIRQTASTGFEARLPAELASEVSSRLPIKLIDVEVPSPYQAAAAYEHGVEPPLLRRVEATWLSRLLARSR